MRPPDPAYPRAGTTHEVILFSLNDGRLYEDTSRLPAERMVRECTGDPHHDGWPDCLEP
jgi:hypothetical protein